MGKYRSRLQIIADILSVVRDNDARKTRIMYLANLSWDLLTRYLNDLIEAGLMRCGRSDHYLLTPKGKRFLERFSEYRKRHKHVVEQIEDVNCEKMTLESMCVATDEKAKR